MAYCFVAIKISEDTILTNVKNVQDLIVEEGKQLPIPIDVQKTMSPLKKLHLTLFQFNAELNEEELASATETLRSVWEKVKEHFQYRRLRLPMRGIRNFSDSVLYASVGNNVNKSADMQPGQRVAKLVERIRHELEKKGFEEKSPNQFVPHVSIARIKANRFKGSSPNNVDKFPREIWENWEDTNFGTQDVQGFLLFRSGTDPRTGGYITVEEFPFKRK